MGGALVMFVDVLHPLDGVPDTLGDNLFRDLFFIEDHDFLDVADAALEILTQRKDFADHDRRARNRLEYAQLATLDALGDFDFALAREQGNGAHLAQVHAHRIIGLFQRARSQIQLNVFAGLGVGFDFFQRRRGLGLAFEHVNALRADGGQQVIEIFGRMDVVRNEIVGFVVGEVALLFSRVNQLLNVVELVFKSSQGNSFSNSWSCQWLSVIWREQRANRRRHV